MADHNGLKVVLFGMPGSGKSSLLGALWQAGQSQEQALGGKISDPSGGLAQLHASVYTKNPEAPSQELTSYPVSLERAGARSIDAVLVDTDGKIAEDCLAQSQDCLSTKTPGAKVVLNADALLLLVDPSAGSGQLEKEFQQFCNFVQNFETHRSHRNEVAGLPVYLVLTKCDMLSKPTDPGSTWVQRIEEGKRKIEKRFHEHLNKNPHRASLPFGKVDVKVWATAVKRPVLADRPVKPQEPYGVAELFRQCFQAAQQFHDHREKAQGLLKIVLLSSLGLIAVMALAAGLFFVTRTSPEVSTLAEKIREALPGQKPADRLKEPLDDRIKKLDDIVADPHFARLPHHQQDEVKQARKEIEAYQTLNKVFVDKLTLGKVPDPKFAKDEGDLANIEKVLNETPLPDNYQEKWNDTALAKKQRQFKQDIDNLRETVTAEHKWFSDMIKEGEDLQKRGGRIFADGIKGKERETWVAQADEFLGRPAQRYKDTERLTGSPGISYGAVYRFRRIEQSLIDLTAVKKKLDNVRRLVAP